MTIMEQELRDFGLSDNEIKIYLALLHRGTIKPADLSRETGFARPYIYDVLQRLQEKNIVGTIIQNQKRCYVALPPNQLVQVCKQRLEAIEKVAEKLETIRLKPLQDISVELQTGRFVLRTLFNDILLHLQRGDEVLFYGIDDDLLITTDPTIKSRLDQYLAKIVSLGITERIIVKQGNTILPQAKTTTYRFLPKATIGSLAFVTYADRLAIFLWGTPNNLIFIQSKKVADSYKNQFDILWKSATQTSKVKEKVSNI